MYICVYISVQIFLLLIILHVDVSLNSHPQPTSVFMLAY